MKKQWLTKINTAGVCTAWIALALAGGQNWSRAQDLTLGSSTIQTTATTYSGQATLINLFNIHNFPSPTVSICDTGPLPGSGGTLEVSVADTNVDNGALTLDTGDALTTGDGNQSFSSTSMNNFQLQIMATNGTVTTVTADFIGSEAVATCKQNGKVSVSANVGIENLVVNGQAININGRPNQVVNFPGGQIIINAQASVVNGNYGDITVAALRINDFGCMQGTVGLAHADITCGTGGPPPPQECGKLTGGGWITGTPTGAKGSFGVSGGIRRGQFWGHLNYIDHGTGMHVISQDVSAFAIDPNNSDCADITYDVTIDGNPGTAYVVACDNDDTGNGEQGPKDTFSITLSNGYSASGDLGDSQPGGGTIQMHKCPPGWLK
ncbi:MAG TPA: choice-of-anchor P family protein [Verrucomicrobiae bacterium]|nr:choice-of-anchor P family protein [Verrucomicrobiae bacterium]